MSPQYFILRLKESISIISVKNSIFAIYCYLLVRVEHLRRVYLPIILSIVFFLVHVRLHAQDSSASLRFHLKSIVQNQYKQLPFFVSRNKRQSSLPKAYPNAAFHLEKKGIKTKAAGDNIKSAFFRSVMPNRVLNATTEKDTCFDSSFTKLFSITGNDVGFTKITHTSDDGAILSGGTFDTSVLHPSWQTNGYVMKTDNQGKIVWVKGFTDGNKQDTVYTIYVLKTYELSNHDIIAVAYLNAGLIEQHSATVLLRLGADGTLRWYKCYNTNLTENTPYNSFDIENITEGLNGDFILCGTTYAANNDYLRYQTIVRIDKNGNIIWDDNFLSYTYNFGGEGINVFIQDGQVVECGTVYGDGADYTSGINFLRMDYNTGNVLDKKFFLPDYTGSLNVLQKSFTAFYSSCVRITSNGHYLVSGNLFSAITNNSDTIDYFGIIDFDSSLNITDSYTISAGRTNVYPSLLIKCNEEQNVLFSVRVDTTAEASEKYMIGAMQGKQLMKERQILYQNTDLGTDPDFCYTNDGGYLFAQNYDVKITDENYLDYTELKKMHNSDTASACVGSDTLFTFLLPWKIKPLVNYNALDSLAINQIQPVSFDIQPLDTFTTNNINPCQQKNYCDTLKIHGTVKICGTNQAYQYTAYKNKACGSFVSWNIDTAIISNATIQNDSTLSVTYKNINRQGKVYANLSGSRCTAPASDSLTVNITSVVQSLQLGNDTVLCDKNVIKLDAGSGFASYKWQDGSRDSSYQATQPGTYYVKTSDNCGNQYSDTIHITAAHYFFSAGKDTSKCNSDTLALIATSGFFNYKWFPANNITDTMSANTHVYPTSDKDYIASAEKYPGCLVSDTIHISVLHSPSIHLGNDTSFCTGQILVLNAGSGFATYNWNTGANTQTITVSGKGTYSIKATWTNGCPSYDSLTVVNVHPLPQFSLGNDTLLCEGELLSYHLALPDATYQWSDGTTASNNTFNKPGTYWLKLLQQGCAKEDTIKISYQPSPVVNLGTDTTLCEGTTKMLDATNPGAVYLWQDNTTEAGYWVTKAGQYFVTVTIDGCSVSDSININFKPKPVFDLGKNINLCKGAGFMLSPLLNTPSNYLWQNGTKQPQLNITTAGTYWLKASNECGSETDSVQVISQVCQLTLPSAFTPNHDGINDVFKVVHPFPVKQFRLMVYNRWGQKIFESEDITKGWDGTCNNVNQDTGSYIWIASLKDEDGITQTAKGVVILLR